jgi:hypothetical protein
MNMTNGVGPEVTWAFAVAGTATAAGHANLRAVQLLLGHASIATTDEGTAPGTIARNVGVGSKTVAHPAVRRRAHTTTEHKDGQESAYERQRR